jgi:formylglycine-generating enzyme required for sulfatase activity
MLTWDALAGALVGLVGAIVRRRDLKSTGLNVIVTGACGIATPFLVERLLSASGVFVGLPIYDLFGITIGKTVISASLAVMSLAPVVGGLIGLGLLGITRRWLLGEPSGITSWPGKIRELTIGAVSLVAGYIVLSISFVIAWALSLGVPLLPHTSAPSPPATRPAADMRAPLPDAPCEGFLTEVRAATRCVKPTESFKDCDTCPEMVVVPAGMFTMGSEDGNYDEKPVHQVTIAKPLAVGRFEVTFAEWDACVADGGCKRKPSDNGKGRGNRPVSHVSFEDIARDYLPWLQRKTGRAYGLLTEAEWEYAARAGSTASYAWGNDVGRNLANCSACGSQWDSKDSAPVGSFPSNRFGLHDMHGNVAEWVADCYSDSYANAASDGSALPDSANCRRVVRGGSWYDYFGNLRSSARSKAHPSVVGAIIGFRVARTL